MRARRRGDRGVVIASLLSIAVAACATTAAPRTGLDVASVTADAHRKARAVGIVLTNSDLASTNEAWTIDAVRRLRPEFLLGSARGPQTGRPEIALYLNNAYIGDVSLLNSIPLAEIRDITFLHPVEARVQFGSACPCANGAVLIATRRARDP